MIHNFQISGIYFLLIIVSCVVYRDKYISKETHNI